MERYLHLLFFSVSVLVSVSTVKVDQDSRGSVCLKRERGKYLPWKKLAVNVHVFTCVWLRLILYLFVSVDCLS